MRHIPQDSSSKSGVAALLVEYPINKRGGAQVGDEYHIHHLVLSLAENAQYYCRVLAL
jgi:hypothetical protein